MKNQSKKRRKKKKICNKLRVDLDKILESFAVVPELVDGPA